MRRAGFFSLLALWSCGNDAPPSPSVAGGSGLGAGNGLTVVATAPDGSPLVSARVVVRRLDWIPDGSVRADSGEATTDAAGRAEISIDDGNWLAEVVSDRGGVALAFRAGDRSRGSWSARVQPTATLAGELPLPGGTRICLGGTGKCAILDAKGSFRLPGLPAHRSRIFVLSGRLADTLEGFPLAGGTENTIDGNRQQLWTEEFVGSSPDPLSWKIRRGDGCPALCGWGNRFLSVFSPLQVSIDPSDSSLVLGLDRIPGDTLYRSGSISTEGLLSWTYGRLEFEAKVPRQAGVWSLVSLFPEGTDPSLWPATGSIDALSLPGTTPDTLRGYAHFSRSGSYAYDFGFARVPDGSWNRSWHRFALDWDSDSLRWWVDDTCFHRWKRTDSGAFDRRFHLQVELHAGGSPWGAPDTSSFQTTQMKLRRIRFTRPWP